jgi:predicted AAA+ superfamily ATPase
MKRYLTSQVVADLNRKMVFIGGPRQVGKTTLSKGLVKKFDYLNWDINTDRERILNQNFKSADLWVFDEIHKYKTWRNYLKGIFDHFGKSQKILVTGSAKLDVLRKGGDSLQGRYHFIRMHTLTVDELKTTSSNDFIDLFKLGGFPEPFFEGNSTTANRWTREYRQTLVRQEVATNEAIQDLGNLELMVNRLPELVGSPLSINALREDLQLSHKTVTRWLDTLERLYCLFRLPPYGSPHIKAVKKEQKLYLYDWNAIKNEGIRFENMVACHLLKWTHFQQDTLGQEIELRYCKDVENREMDFVLLENQKPVMFIETKLSDVDVTDSTRYLSSKHPGVATYQIYLKGKKDYVNKNGIRVMPALKFLLENFSIPTLDE